MMCKSPIAKILWIISMWLGVVACLDLGLLPILHERPLQTLLMKLNMFEMLWIPLHYVVLAAGIILLLGLLMHKGGMKTSCHCD